MAWPPMVEIGPELEYFSIIEAGEGGGGSLRTQTIDPRNSSLILLQ